MLRTFWYHEPLKWYVERPGHSQPESLIADRLEIDDGVLIFSTKGRELALTYGVGAWLSAWPDDTDQKPNPRPADLETTTSKVVP